MLKAARRMASSQQFSVLKKLGTFQNKWNATLPQMARALARDHAADDIRVNVITPGIIETRFHANMTPERRQHSIEHRIPLRRFGTPEDVADASAALIRNRFITGETLVIDGGMTMRMV